MRSIDDSLDDHKDSYELQSPSIKDEPAPEPEPTKPSIQPRLGLLFALSSRAEIFLRVGPALVLSVCAGALPFFVSLLLGKAFDNFGTYQTAMQEIESTTSSPTALAEPAAKLKHDQLIISLLLFAVGGLSLTLTTAALTLWARYGELVTDRLRRQVYTAVSRKSLAWFDTGMGGSVTEESANGETLGGLTARFSRETDDVRIALSGNVGTSAQYIVTFLACFIQAVVVSAKLTFVIFASFPLVIILTAISERFAMPLLEQDRDLTAAAAGRVEQVTGAISTVKAFNAETAEQKQLDKLLMSVKSAFIRLCAVWGARLGLTSFLLLSMFVQGFWFGSYLVGRGDLTGGQVSQVFWACLLSASHLQLVVPLLSFIDKGKIGMAGMLELIGADGPEADRRISTLQKLRPATFKGELSLRSITFWYPARPAPAEPALRNVSLFLPPRETTYIVGQSGSGKSTIGALLMGLYQPDMGRVEADERAIDLLDPAWLRSHVAMVSQGMSIVMEGTVHDNVAVGAIGSDRRPEDVTREEVIAACRCALIHDFIRDLPDGYDTLLSGEKGASLSGGQRQRLALARARIRDPTVLILALDLTSRVLVHEAIKTWRRSRTTIIITHDLSPIVDSDFVYVMRDGSIVEEGYRSDLLSRPDGWFHEMARIQSQKVDEPEQQEAEESVDDLLSRIDDEISNAQAPSVLAPWLDLYLRPASMRPNSLRPTSFMRQFARRSSAFERPISGLVIPASRSRPPTRYLTPSSRLSGNMSRASMYAAPHFRARGRVALPSTPAEEESPKSFTVAIEPEPDQDIADMSLARFIPTFWPTLPSKWLLLIGLVFCIMTGCVTPVFSILVAQLLAALVPGSGVNLVQTSLLVLLVSAIDGLAQCMRYALMQAAAMRWITVMRGQAFRKVLAQDKAWFDRPANTPVVLLTTIVKDAEDARNVVGVIIPQIIVCMLGLGLIWAIATSWQLTLTGLAIAPLFVISLLWQAAVVDRFERTNKALREDAAKHFHQTITNVRAIRAMSLERAFATRFDAAADKCFAGHLKAAPYVGICFAVSAAVPRITEGCLFLVGATLLANGQNSFAQILRAFSLMSFSVAFSSSMLGYIPALSKSKRAAVDLLRLLRLDDQPSEAQGKETYPVTGSVEFKNVSFAYPTREDAQALSDVSFSIRAGESVGLVGSSGSGKSTVVALMQRLYEPGTGQITLDGHKLADTDVHFLREHVAVVSQHASFLADSVADNITYGSLQDRDSAVAAARLADAHEFVSGKLSNGYDTLIGENAGLISGGQAQRLQIARALARPRELLILDEATSALDAESQAAVMQTIRQVKSGRTTVVVTHKLDMMRMCDRLIVLDHGRVAEIGTFDDLIARRGAFTALVSQGDCT